MWNVPAWLTFQFCECFSQLSEMSGLLLQLLHCHQLVVDRRLLLDLLHWLLQVTEKEQTEGWTPGITLQHLHFDYAFISEWCYLSFSKKPPPINCLSITWQRDYAFWTAELEECGRVFKSLKVQPRISSNEFILLKYYVCLRLMSCKSALSYVMNESWMYNEPILNWRLVRVRSSNSSTN